MRALGPSGTISRVKPVNRRWFQRLADIAIPWGVGLFYVLVVLGDEYDERVPTGIGLLLAVLQGAALRWRRSHPELVIVAALAGGGVAFWLLAPKVVIPFAGLFAVYSLAWVAAAFAAASELLRRRDLE